MLITNCVNWKMNISDIRQDAEICVPYLTGYILYIITDKIKQHKKKLVQLYFQNGGRSPKFYLNYKVKDTRDTGRPPTKCKN